MPSAAAGSSQRPVAESQVPATWHWSEAVQTTGSAPTQPPAWQVSLWVQASLSLQAVPSAAAGSSHRPVAESQVPATWHWSEAVQTTGFEPTHAPASQASLWVQASLSLQALPSAAAGSSQRPVAESQVPAT